MSAADEVCSEDSRFWRASRTVCVLLHALPPGGNDREQLAQPIHAARSIWDRSTTLTCADLGGRGKQRERRWIKMEAARHPPLFAFARRSPRASSFQHYRIRIDLDQGHVNTVQGILITPGRKEFAMCSSSRLERTTVANIGKMMGRLGIDMGYAALPRYGLAFSSALRACNSCTARAQCAQWMAKTRQTAFGPPKFCASVDLLWELLCDPAIGNRPQSVQ